MRAKAWLLATVGGGLVLCGVLSGIGGGSQQESNETDVDWQRCSEIVSIYQREKVDSIDDLILQYDLIQLTMLPIAPPNEAKPFVTGQGRFLLFAPESMPGGFVDKLVPVMHEDLGVVIYPVWIIESPFSRDRKVVAADGTTLVTVPAADDYDPYWFVRLCGVDPGISQDSWMVRIFDPARIMARFNLVTEEALRIIAFRQAVAEASLTPWPGGGGMQMMMGGEGVTNLQFVGVELYDTNGAIEVGLAWPEDFTNRISLITCTNLLDPDWSLLLTTNVPTSTNTFAYVDTNACSYSQRFYHAFNADVNEATDPDDDGVTSGEERFLLGTDPEDGNDPANIKGGVGYQTYSGGQTGPIYVVAVTASNNWSTNYSDTLAQTGAYHIVKVPTNSYWIKAWRDSDVNGSVGTYEATGLYSTASLSVTGQHTNINVTLYDPDTDSDGLGDWWEIKHFQGLTAVGGDDGDEDKLSNLLEYKSGTDPTEGGDTDGDGMSDDWEDVNGLDKANASDADEDPDEDGFTNLEEYQNNGGASGTDPTDPTDHPSGAVYVDDDGNDLTGDGTYTNAYASISTGIVHAATGRVVVLAGTYTGAANRNMSYEGKDLLVIGAAGVEETIIDCQQSGRAFVFHNSETTNAILRGFTMQNGSSTYGGAIYCTNSSPLIENCTFVSNSATLGGGAVFTWSASPELQKCLFLENSTSGANADGGALQIWTGTGDMLIEGCTFSSNSAGGNGGAAITWLIEGAEHRFRNCLISGNHAEGLGGGVLFAGNSLVFTVESCTIAANTYSGDSSGGGICSYVNHPGEIRNCIVWSNSPPQVGLSYEADVTYCNIQNWTEGGTGNITNAPGFIDGEYRFGSSSPCKDVGTNQTWMADATDLFGNDRIYNDTVDMGSFEYHAP